MRRRKVAAWSHFRFKAPPLNEPPRISLNLFATFAYSFIIDSLFYFVCLFVFFVLRPGWPTNCYIQFHHPNICYSIFVLQMSPRAPNTTILFVSFYLQRFFLFCVSRNRKSQFMWNFLFRLDKAENTTSLSAKPRKSF